MRRSRWPKRRRTAPRRPGREGKIASHSYDEKDTLSDCNGPQARLQFSWVRKRRDFRNVSAVAQPARAHDAYRRGNRHRHRGAGRVGSLAERLQTIVARSAALSGGAIFAFSPPRELAGPDAAARMRRRIRQVERFAGVAGVVPEVVVPYKTGFAEAGRFGPPSLVFGLPYSARRFASAAMAVERGATSRPASGGWRSSERTSRAPNA